MNKDRPFDYLPGTEKSPLQEGDKAVDFETYDQNRNKVRLSELVTQAPVLLITTFGMGSNLRQSSLDEIKKFEPAMEGTPYQLCTINPAVWTTLKAEQEKWGFQSVRALDDGNYAIGYTYTEINTSMCGWYAYFIDSFMTINKLIKVGRKWSETEYFFEDIRKYLKGEL